MMAEQLRLGFFTRGNSKKCVEDLPAYLFHRRFAIRDAARVDIHVAEHAAVSVRVARDLEYRHTGETDSAAPSCGERNQVDSAGGETGDGNRIVTWRVHENETGRFDAFCVIDDIFKRGRARFGDGSQGFFQNVGEAAFLVARRRVVVEAASELAKIGLIMLNLAKQLFRNFRVSGAADEEVLGANDFRGFCEYDCAAQRRQSNRNRSQVRDWL